MGNTALRWCLLGLVASALILGPFALFESTLREAAEFLLRADGSREAAAFSVVLLLAADVFLPVPSSLVATASGLLLGLARGAAVTWIGMQAGALAGYAFGRSVGLSAAVRFVGHEAAARASVSHRRWGRFSLVAARAVPVLAEASVVLAGALRMPARTFALATGISNAVIALAYAAVGAYALETNAFLLAFGGSIGISGVLMSVGHAIARAPGAAGSVARGKGSEGLR